MEEPLAARVSPIKAVLESVVNDFANASFTAGGEETSKSRASVRENATIELWLELCCAQCSCEILMLWVRRLQNLVSVVAECEVGGETYLE